MEAENRQRIVAPFLRTLSGEFEHLTTRALQQSGDLVECKKFVIRVGHDGRSYPKISVSHDSVTDWFRSVVTSGWPKMSVLYTDRRIKIVDSLPVKIEIGSVLKSDQLDFGWSERQGGALSCVHRKILADVDEGHR
jgi:hypothetical protein